MFFSEVNFFYIGKRERRTHRPAASLQLFWFLFLLGYQTFCNKIGTNRKIQGRVWKIRSAAEFEKFCNTFCCSHNLEQHVDNACHHHEQWGIDSPVEEILIDAASCCFHIFGGPCYLDLFSIAWMMQKPIAGINYFAPAVLYLFLYFYKGIRFANNRSLGGFAGLFCILTDEIDSYSTSGLILSTSKV